MTICYYAIDDEDIRKVKLDVFCSKSDGVFQKRKW